MSDPKEDQHQITSSLGFPISPGNQIILQFNNEGKGTNSFCSRRYTSSEMCLSTMRVETQKQQQQKKWLQYDKLCLDPLNNDIAVSSLHSFIMTGQTKANHFLKKSTFVRKHERAIEAVDEYLVFCIRASFQINPSYPYFFVVQHHSSQFSLYCVENNYGQWSFSCYQLRIRIIERMFWILHGLRNQPIAYKYKLRNIVLINSFQARW